MIPRALLRRGQRLSTQLDSQQPAAFSQDPHTLSRASLTRASSSSVLFEEAINFLAWGRRKGPREEEEREEGGGSRGESVGWEAGGAAGV